ncbi:hypothetical protein FB465_5409 [Kitasatospora atroaurantiaca]|uniref:Uncharacterized protein n=2 Tax=Kitasatospora atroaurantiaca TaxID=285545 RepID=A0A561EXB8_9ACTN|nr:hypothetical protein FB465_5409 [Kitasatospora atroaurantiaca]
MEMQITVDAQGDDAAAHDLYYWLRQDRELRRYAEVELAQAPDVSDRMNAGEIINMFVSNGIAAASLLVNIVVAWRAARPSPPGVVTFERDGMTVTVHDGLDETLCRVAELLASEPHGGAPGATGVGQSSTPSVSGNR